MTIYQIEKVKGLAKEYKADPNCKPGLWIKNEDVTPEEKDLFLRLVKVKTAQELGQKEPKVKIGDKVRMSSPDLYGYTDGEVVEVERMYKKLDKFTGEIDPMGLVTGEETINNIKLPYRFDGETLEVDYPETKFGEWTHQARTEKSVFYGYSVTVETEEMRTMIPERHIKKL